MKLDIEPEHLESLYHGNGYTLRQIANILGYDRGTITRRMIKYGIPRRVSGPSKVIIEPELLWDLYWGNDYTLRQIANIFGCSDQAILNRMKDHGIPSRHTGCKLTDFTFNDRQKEIFEGCMLGVGGLTWGTNYCCFCNGDLHEEYLIWLKKQLGIEDISRIIPRVDGVYRLITRAIPSIRDEHKRWYPYTTKHGTNQNHNTKIIPKDIELTPIKMLFWYLGDGTYEKISNRTSFTSCLYLDDWALLSDKIGDLLGVDNGISINKNRKDKLGIQRYILRLNKGATNKFFDMVDSLGFDIPECYQYKFGR